MRYGYSRKEKRQAGRDSNYVVVDFKHRCDEAVEIENCTSIGDADASIRITSLRQCEYLTYEI